MDTSLNAEQLSLFYEQRLKNVPNYDNIFIVEKIRAVRADVKSNTMYALVDWKYFDPSDESLEDNWISIWEVDEALLTDFVKTE